MPDACDYYSCYDCCLISCFCFTCGARTLASPPGERCLHHLTGVCRETAASVTSRPGGSVSGLENTPSLTGRGARGPSPPQSLCRIRATCVHLRLSERGPELSTHMHFANAEDCMYVNSYEHELRNTQRPGFPSEQEETKHFYVRSYFPLLSIDVKALVLRGEEPRCLSSVGSTGRLHPQLHRTSPVHRASPAGSTGNWLSLLSFLWRLPSLNT